MSRPRPASGSANSATKFKIGPVFVSATTRLSIKSQGSQRSLLTYRVHATTALNVGSRSAVSATLRAFFVNATTRMTVGLGASEVRTIPASASTSFQVGAVSVKNGRDIRVSATTAMKMGLVDASNGFFRISATPSGIELLIQATASKAGTPADTGLVFVHRADAEVWLPWRRSSLSLPPGGQLPH
jgi:hypothetical protein